MMRYIANIVVISMVMLLSVGCFKDEVQGTLFKIHVVSQEETDSELEDCTTELRAYAFNTKKGEKWEVASWDDALAMRITNKNNSSQVLTEPDVIGKIGRASCRERV